MTTFTTTLAAAVWALASAAAVLLLGVASLWGGRSRPRGALAFGMFALVLGAQLLVGNLTRVVAGPGEAATLHLLSAALLVPLPYLLFEFGASQLPAAGRAAVARARVGVAGFGIAVAALLMLDPGLILRGVEVEAGLPRPRWGVLYAPLVVLPYFAGLSFALYALHKAKSGAPTPRTRERAATLLAGLGLFVAFVAGNNLSFYALGALYYPLETTDWLFVAALAALSAATVAIAVRSLARARRALPGEARLDRLVAASLLVPFAWGVLEALATLASGLPEFDTTGLWRLAGVGVIAFGLARWRVHDLPQRARTAAVATGGAAAAGAAGAAAYGLGSVATQGPLAPLALGALGVAAALLPSIRLARRLFSASATGEATRDAAYGQRIDAYRAAVEASLARGTLEEDEAFLGALRERFGIGEAEDRVVRHYARASVVVPRSRGAWEAYERLRLLGEGGGGRTWLARDRARDRLVVLKEPLERWQAEPGAREAVLREARLAAKVRHPNVVSVEEVVEGNGAPVIVMEYLEGGSLADLVRARGSLRASEAVPLMIDVLAGLEAVHSAGIVHRDVKPSNVLLAGDGTAKVADFGIALAARADAGRTLVMEPPGGAVAGTRAYMAPEVREGRSPGDRRSDVYACGVLLHELLHGAPPGVATPAILRREVPPAVSAAVARALAERPEDRFPTARAFAEEIARALR